MRDLYGYRRMYGIATPSVNTCVQPEMDRMRPHGVTNHIARMHVPDLKIRSDEDFAKGIDALFESIDAAVDQLITCQPDHLILGISALAIWGGSRKASRELATRIQNRAGGKLPVSLASDALIEALQALNVKRRIAIVEPYYPIIQPRMESFFGECGYEIVRFNHMQGGQFTGYTKTTRQALIKELTAIDSPDVEALIKTITDQVMSALNGVRN